MLNKLAQRIEIWTFHSQPLCHNVPVIALLPPSSKPTLLDCSMKMILDPSNILFSPVTAGKKLCQWKGFSSPCSSAHSQQWTPASTCRSSVPQLGNTGASNTKQLAASLGTQTLPLCRSASPAPAVLQVLLPAPTLHTCGHSAAAICLTTFLHDQGILRQRPSHPWITLSFPQALLLWCMIASSTHKGQISLATQRADLWRFLLQG